MLSTEHGKQREWVPLPSIWWTQLDRVLVSKPGDLRANNEGWMEKTGGNKIKIAHV